MNRPGCCLLIVLMLNAHLTCADEVDFARQIQPLLARKCFVCHGPSDQKSGLALHARSKATSKAESALAAIVPGDPNRSELIRRISSDDPDQRMPPEGEPLTATEIALLRTWIRTGADYAKHWAWQKPVAARPPNSSLSQQARNEVDHFVFHRLETEGLKPSPQANPYTLLRRLYLDLTGLPPEPHDVRRFVEALRPADNSSGSVETDLPRNPIIDAKRLDKTFDEVIERLLASPHFGERWGRHWLDLARYADSFGYERDDVRPNAWRYRDWVVEAINRDLPYDRFIVEQLAGDLIPDATTDQRIAAGFNRMNVQNNESGINKEDYRNREIVDRINTTATAFLGVTLGCSQCHDHKYDSFSQREYYQFYAFFNNSIADDRDIEGTDAERAAYETALAKYKQHENELKNRKALLDRIQKAGGVDALKTESQKESEIREILDALALGDELLSAIESPVENRTTALSGIVEQFNQSISGRIDDINKAQRQLSVENRHLPRPYIMTLREADKDRRTTHVLVRGEFKVKGDIVEHAVPTALNPYEPASATPTRLDLARWIVHPDNPLAARVAVNHVWKHLFGNALVRTMDDFGVQGDPPTHPALLNWLAATFRDGGWSRKDLIRTIVNSATYRQASHHREDLQTLDPQNLLLARQTRFRVEGEIVRDISLTASGLLSRKVGGPTIRPAVSESVRDLAYKYKTRWVVSDKPDRYRRGLYIHFKRTNPYPSLITFDTPESNVCTAMRNRTNSPLQALTTLNDPVFVETAQAFARRIIEQVTADPTQRIRYGVLVALGRPATDSEIAALRKLFDEESQHFKQHPDAAASASGEFLPSNVPAHESAAWTSVTQTLMNLDEFLTRD